MKKILIIFALLFSLLLVACNNIDPNTQKDATPIVEIQNIEYQDDIFVIYADNTGSAGYYKFEIQYIEFHSKTDTVPHEFSSDKMYAEEGLFVYEFPIGEHDIITEIITYSLQKGEWVETDIKRFGTTC